MITLKPNNLLQTESKGEILKLLFMGKRLDANISQALKKEIEKVWVADTRQVIMDLGDVEFIDSSGIGVLLSLYKRLPAHSGHLKLVSVQPSVLAVIELLRLQHVFDIGDK